MNNLVVSDNQILFSRQGELVRITPCGENAIRFQAFPGGSVINENYTLMPKESQSVKPKMSAVYVCSAVV